eukprot:Gb_07621 [translate_table: standard]
MQHYHVKWIQNPKTHILLMWSLPFLFMMSRKLLLDLLHQTLLLLIFFHNWFFMVLLMDTPFPLTIMMTWQLLFDLVLEPLLLSPPFLLPTPFLLIARRAGAGAVTAMKLALGTVFMLLCLSGSRSVDLVVRDSRWSSMVRFAVGMGCRLMRNSSGLGRMERRVMVVDVGLPIFLLLTKQTKQTAVLLLCGWHGLA